MGGVQPSKRVKMSVPSAIRLATCIPTSQRVYAPIDLAALLGDGLLDAVKAGVGLAVLLGQLLGDASSRPPPGKDYDC